MAPRRETSMSSAYSTPCPKVPEAVMTGFFRRRPRAATTSRNPNGRGLALSERDIAQTEDGALSTHTGVPVRGHDHTGAANAHRTAHVLLDSDLRFEERDPAGIRPRGAFGLLAKAPE